MFSPTMTDVYWSNIHMVINQIPQQNDDCINAELSSHFVQASYYHRKHTFTAVGVWWKLPRLILNLMHWHWHSMHISLPSSTQISGDISDWHWSHNVIGYQIICIKGSFKFLSLVRRDYIWYYDVTFRAILPFIRRMIAHIHYTHLKKLEEKPLDADCSPKKHCPWWPSSKIILWRLIL